jgi:hypothetical protein
MTAAALSMSRAATRSSLLILAHTLLAGTESQKPFIPDTGKFGGFFFRDKHFFEKCCIRTPVRRFNHPRMQEIFHFRILFFF